jgi:hypothetical protein
MSDSEGKRTYFDPDQFGRRRDDSNSLFGRAAALGMKYNWLITLLFALLLMLGFGFRTPQDVFSEIKAEVRANKSATDSAIDTLRDRASNIESQNRNLKNLLEASVIAQCKSLKPDARQYLPCARLYREWGIE